MRLSILGAAVLLLSLPLLAQFHFQPVDVPGALETQVRGINRSGDIVGFYRVANAACIPYAMYDVQVSPCDQRGFRVVNGVLTTLMVPDSLSTAILGINDAGDMVGYYTKTSEDCVIEQHGFLWDRRNTIRNLDYTEASGFCGTEALWTVPFAINNAGTVVGSLWSPLDGFPFGAFVYRKGTFRAVEPISLEGGCFQCTSVTAISNAGWVIGTTYRVFDLIPLWVGFTKRGAKEAFFTRTQDDTWATGINDAGNVVGYGVYGAGFFVRHVEGLDNYDLEPLVHVHYPDSVGTYPFALNDRRIVVGSYMALDGTLHGFVAAPAF